MDNFKGVDPIKIQDLCIYLCTNKLFIWLSERCEPFINKMQVEWKLRFFSFWRQGNIIFFQFFKKTVLGRLFRMWLLLLLHKQIYISTIKSMILFWHKELCCSKVIEVIILEVFFWRGFLSVVPFSVLLLLF